MNTLHVFTNAFTDHSCMNSPPKNFQWTFNTYPTDNSPVIYVDDSIFRRINDDYSGPKYGWLCESSEIIPNLINGCASNKNVLKLKYKSIFTNDRRIINLDPTFFRYNPPASNMPWIKQPAVYEKNKLCSYITSFKRYTSGHVKRLELFEKLKNDPRFSDHIFGRDYRNLPDKLDGLKDYMFSIVVENSIYPKYYTEKITDCFATGTIPIYYGDESICEDFDRNGILFIDEIDLNELTPELYYSRMSSVINDYNAVQNLVTADDCLYKSVKND